MNRYPILVIFFINILTYNALGNKKNIFSYDTTNISKTIVDTEKFLNDNPQKVICIAENLIKQLENDKLSEEYIRTVYLKASANSNLENYSVALKDYKICINHRFFYEDTNKLAELKFNIARCYHCIADIYNAQQWYLESLKLYQIKSNIYGQAKVLQNIGIIESDRRRDGFAMVYYNKAYDLYHLLGNKAKEAAVLQNIGVVYSNQNNLKKTIEYYYKALKIFTSTGNIEGIASTENNIGIAYEKAEKYSEALSHYKIALANFKKLNSRTGIAYVYDNLGSLYKNLNKDTALANYRLSLQYADSVEALDLLAYVNEEMAGLLEQMGKYKEALHYYKTAKQIQDSITHDDNKKKLSQAEAIFQGELKDIEIQKKEFQLKVQKRETTIYLCGVIVLAILLASLIWAYHKKTLAENQIRKQQEYLEEQVQQRTNELKIEMFERKAAEEADKLKTAFLANMSHEIRTPMNAILAFSNFLKDPEISGTQRNEYVKYINSCSISLLHLIDDILDTAKIEAKQLKIVETKCYVSSIIKELYVYFQNHKKCLEGSITLKVKPHCLEKNYAITTDGTRLRQIFTNLLDNAFKFTDKGTIEFGFDIYNSNMLFFVSDTGTGIPADKISFIFKRFGQLHDNTKKIYKGTGLGLSISKNLVELLGGTMWVESREGKGSCFSFTIPAKNLEISEITTAKAPENAANTKTINWKSFNILVAEDDDLNYKLIHIALSKTQANILRASNGEEVLKIVSETPDIHTVLMDIQMPVLDGYETTKRLKSRFPDIFVIAQTAFAMSDDKEKCFQAGCDDYISKPIDVDELYNKLGLLFKKLPINTTS